MELLTSTSASAPIVVGLPTTSGEFSLLLPVLFLRGGTGGASVVGVVGGGGVVTGGGGGRYGGGCRLGEVELSKESCETERAMLRLSPRENKEDMEVDGLSSGVATGLEGKCSALCRLGVRYFFFRTKYFSP